MDIKELTPKLSVAGQILPSELASLADAGFTTLIVNRPDGEANDQPNFAQIQAAAEAVGINAIYQPITPSQIGDEEAAAFKSALASADGPVLAFCRTGNRSASLWNFEGEAKS